MPRFWIRHARGHVRRVDAGRVACDLHAGLATVEDCQDCSRFRGVLHEGERDSVLCRPEPTPPAPAPMPPEPSDP
jgi:hypothetical protein